MGLQYGLTWGGLPANRGRSTKVSRSTGLIPKGLFTPAQVAATPCRPELGVFSPRSTEYDKAHRRIETWTIRVTQSIAGPRFPHAAHGFRIERTTWLSNGQTRREVVFGVTSLPADRAGERGPLRLVRGHWGIEALDHIRDVSYDEGRSRARTGNGPQAMAALRNCSIGLLRRLHIPNIAAALRHLHRHPAAVAMVLGL